MADLTVEMVQRGRGPSSQEVAKRRGIAREMRSVRERLTSTSGLERAFDYELLRLYAQYRVGAGIPLLLLALLAGPLPVPSHQEPDGSAREEGHRRRQHHGQRLHV